MGYDFIPQAGRRILRCPLPAAPKVWIGLSPPDPVDCKLLACKEEMAGSTRLELATSGVTGRRSNQLNYDPVNVLSCRPPSRFAGDGSRSEEMGGGGFEPTTAGV